MFWQEEDVQPAVDRAVEMFGRVGSVHYGKSVKMNISLATKEYGKIWYGDVDMDDNTFMTNCSNLAKALNSNIYIFDAGNNFDYSTAINTQLPN